MTDQQTADVTTDAWDGFVKGHWSEAIDVRDFIQRNYTPYEGDASFLAGPTEKTLRVWETLEKDYLSKERKVRILDVDTHTPADIDAFKPGYISDDDDVIVGLQTDAPLKRAMMPNGGWRMVETAIKEAGKEARRLYCRVSCDKRRACAKKKRSKENKSIGRSEEDCGEKAKSKEERNVYQRRESQNSP